MLAQRGTGGEHGFDHRQQPRSISEQLQYPRLEGGNRDLAKLEAEGFEGAADFVVDRHALL